MQRYLNDSDFHGTFSMKKAQLMENHKQSCPNYDKAYTDKREMLWQKIFIIVAFGDER